MKSKSCGKRAVIKQKGEKISKKKKRYIMDKCQIMNICVSAPKQNQTRSSDGGEYRAQEAESRVFAREKRRG